MIKIKVRFEDCLESIPSASTTKEISILTVFQTHPALRAPAVHGVCGWDNRGFRCPLLLAHIDQIRILNF